MPANAQNTIESFAEVIGATSYDYSTQDTGAYLFDIPGSSVGTTLVLPAEPNNGDWYEFADADGSCSSTHPVTVAARSGATIVGGASVSFASAFCSAKVRYVARTQAWVFISGPGTGDITAIDAGPGISVATAGSVATVSNTGVLAIDGGTGIAAVTIDGVTTVSNEGVLEVAAGTGIGVGTVSGVATVTNEGILGVAAGTGISVAVVSGVATVTNTEPAGAAITSTTTTAANVALTTAAAAIVTSPGVTVGAGQKVLVLFSCQVANTGEVVTGGEELATFLARFDTTTVDTFVQHLLNGTDNDSQIVSWSWEATGLSGSHTFSIEGSVDDATASPSVILARITTVLLPG
jgi:hypothetical protein